MSLKVDSGYEAYEEIIEKAYRKLDPIDQISRHGTPVRKVRLKAEDVADQQSIPDDIILVIVCFEAELGQRNPDAKPHWQLRDITLRRKSDRNYIVVPEKGKTRKETREAIPTTGDVRKKRKKPAAKKATPKKEGADAPSSDDEFND